MVIVVRRNTLVASNQRKNQILGSAVGRAELDKGGKWVCEFPAMYSAAIGFDIRIGAAISWPLFRIAAPVVRLHV